MDFVFHEMFEKTTYTSAHVCNLDCNVILKHNIAHSHTCKGWLNVAITSEWTKRSVLMSKKSFVLLIYWVNFSHSRLDQMHAFFLVFSKYWIKSFSIFIDWYIYSEHDMSLIGERESNQENRIACAAHTFFSLHDIIYNIQWQSNVCMDINRIFMKSGNVYNFQYEVLSFRSISLSLSTQSDCSTIA